ncbi:MAG: ABC transporter substrate-binding protein [Lachnospiraceae bacterium]|nr:ABC transporter substrate-binding protein [Lachnospiraceae bacterium]
MKKKTWIAGLLTATLLFSLAGCGDTAGSGSATANAAGTATTTTTTTTDAGAGTADTTTGSQDVITIRSSFFAGMTSSVHNYAVQKGLYEKEGIIFEETQASTGNDKLALFSRGEIDVADGDPSTYIPAISNGVPVKLVGNMWRYSGCYWLIANNDVKDISDLVGKKIGTAGSSGGMKLSVLKILEDQGISEDSVELIANGSRQEAYATLTSGEVDATIIHNPYAALSEAEGTGHVLARAWDYIPDYYTGCIVASDDFIKNHPEELQRFVTAYYKVHEEVKNEYFDDFIKWAAETMSTDEAVMRNAVNAEIDVWLDYPVIPEDRVNYTVDLMKKYGWMDEAVSVEGSYTNEFAIKAAEELGLKDPLAK